MAQSGDGGQGDMKLKASQQYFRSTTPLGLDNYSPQKVLFLFSERSQNSNKSNLTGRK